MRGRGGARSGVVPEVDAAPVADGAFGQHHEEAERADEDHGPRREARARVPPRSERSPLRAAVVIQRLSNNKATPTIRALDARIESCRRRDGDESGGGEAADAPAAVERRHDRPVERLLDRDAVSVHRDVHRAVARSEHEEDRSEHVRARRKQRERQHQAEHERRPPGDAMRSGGGRRGGRSTASRRALRRPCRAGRGRASPSRCRDDPAATGCGPPRSRSSPR